MIIARNTVAKLLETTPNNIKELKQVEDNIYIQLADSEDKLFFTIQEYQNCLQQLKRNKEHIDSTKFLTIATIIGTFLFVTISSINTDFANNQPDQSNSIQLVVEADR